MKCIQPGCCARPTTRFYSSGEGLKISCVSCPAHSEAAWLYMGQRVSDHRRVRDLCDPTNHAPTGMIKTRKV